MKKEEIYVNLQGKTKEELTELWEFLTSNGEPMYCDFRTNKGNYTLEFFEESWIGCGKPESGKQEVTIEQLKQIIKPMETKFTPIAMKCNKEQFEAIKPKLKGLQVRMITNFVEMPYLINNRNGYINNITNYMKSDAGKVIVRFVNFWYYIHFLKV